MLPANTNPTPSTGNQAAASATTAGNVAANASAAIHPADMGQLEDIALTLMGHMLQNRRMDGYMDQKVAREAFRAAKAFMDVSAAVASGEFIPEQEKPLSLKPIEVPVWRNTSDDKWQVIKDPQTNKVITESVLPDPYSYAPNLPPEHPINLRFQPMDGVSVTERIERFKSDQDQARMAREAALN